MGAPIPDRHDCVLPGEGHHVTSAQVFIELHTLGEGPWDLEILHHVEVLELVLD
jgi:hypothetical protein